MTGPHKQLVLSGMQPTNTLHLGNYLGALKNWVRMQNEMPCLFCVVDMHAITQDVGYGKAAELAQSTREVAAAYIAAGVDPKRTPIFNQSQVPEHGELSWVFNCVARLGWLDRMTQFKEKSGKHKERASVGLYTYPVLMAADILVYKATHVPGAKTKSNIWNWLATSRRNSITTSTSTISFPSPNRSSPGQVHVS